MVRGRFLVSRCCCDPCQQFAALQLVGGLSSSMESISTASVTAQVATQTECSPRALHVEQRVENSIQSPPDLGQVINPPTSFTTVFNLRQSVVYTLVADLDVTTTANPNGLSTDATTAYRVRIGRDGFASAGANYYHLDQVFEGSREFRCTPDANGGVLIGGTRGPSSNPNSNSHYVKQSTVFNQNIGRNTRGGFPLNFAADTEDVPLGHLSAAIVRRGGTIFVYQRYTEGGEWVEVDQYEGCTTQIEWSTGTDARAANLNRDQPIVPLATDATATILGMWNLTDTESPDLPA